MSTRPPQLDRPSRGKGTYRKFLKKHTNRVHRRAAKRDPEDAPRQRRWSGYES